MALYTIGDLHLSLGSNKPMDIFGDRWQNYVEKIRLGFSALTEDDTTVLCGSSLTLSNRAKNWARRPYRCPRMRSTWPLFSRRLRPLPMHSYIVSQCPSK